MKFLLPLILATSSVVLAQHATILLPKNKEVRIGDGYKCYEKNSGKAKGIKAKKGVEVQFFKNDNCNGQWKWRAWGKYNFTDSISYDSVKLAKHKSKKKSDKKIKVESFEEDTDDKDADSADEADSDDDSTDDTKTDDTADDDDAGSEENKE